MPRIKTKPKQTSKIKRNDRITGNDLGDAVVLLCAAGGLFLGHYLRSFGTGTSIPRSGVTKTIGKLKIS